MEPANPSFVSNVIPVEFYMHNNEIKEEEADRQHHPISRLYVRRQAGRAGWEQTAVGPAVAHLAKLTSVYWLLVFLFLHAVWESWGLFKDLSQFCIVPPGWYVASRLLSPKSLWMLMYLCQFNKAWISLQLPCVNVPVTWLNGPWGKKGRKGEWEWQYIGGAKDNELPITAEEHSRRNIVIKCSVLLN